MSVLLYSTTVLAQSAPSSSDRPWRVPTDVSLGREARSLSDPSSWIDPNGRYSLAELINLAEARNPETRVAWQQAQAQAAALGVARSELYPTLAAAALSDSRREAVLLGDTFITQTLQTFQAAFSVSYTIFDFGGRRGRIEAASADVLGANFAFNDSHRKIVYQVAQAYYELLNASGQEGAAQASLTNAETVQQAAESRLQQGLATLPDVLEARSATAQAQYQLQAVLGDVEIARGNLTVALGAFPTVRINVQPIDELTIPESVDETVDQAIDRALAQRPDLTQQLADIRSAEAGIKEARAAFYPILSASALPAGQRLFGLQRPSPWTHTGGVFGRVSVNLSWTLFDGGARKNNLAQAAATAGAAAAQADRTRDQIANEVWAAYARFNTALRQRQAAIALLDAARQSYDASLESYNSGVRSLLDVTAAQRTLAQARATDVLARAQVLTALAELSFRTADSIRRESTPKP